MIGAGTIINPIVKVVTTVVILGAIYYFFVRPVLDTTENIAGQTAGQIEQAQREANRAGSQADAELSRSRADSFAQSLSLSWPAAAREIRSCIRGASGEARALSRCERRGETLTHTVQQDRSFALSYAGSLAAQERAADAARVRNCVEKAGFGVGAMERCRELAGDLLF